MRKRKSSLALLLAVAMVFQFCLFSSQSAWAGQVDVNTDEQVQELAEDQAADVVTDESSGDMSEDEAVLADEDAEEGTDLEEPVVSDEAEDSEEAVEADEEEQPAADEEEAAEELPAPAAPISDKVFRGKAGGVNVVVSAPAGAFEEGTTMQVKKASEEAVIAAAQDLVDGDIAMVKAVDITFFDKDGNEVQPKKEVSVALQSAAIDESADQEVIHIDGDKAEVIEGATFDGQNAAFGADHFSIYAVVETGNDARIKVTFMAGEDEVASVYVKKSDLENDRIDDILYDPSVTLEDGVLFEGWMSSADYTVEDKGMDIADVREEVAAKLNEGVTDGDEVTYYAKLVKQYNVSYLDGNETCLGTTALKVRADEENATLDYTVNQAYVPGGEENFEGWKVAKGGSNIEGYEAGKVYKNTDKIKLTGSVVFSVNAPKGHWLVIHENGKGATYNAPQFVKTGETTDESKLLEMERTGYEFEGWYTDEACTDGNEFSFGGELSDTTHIYAKWEAATSANYTILIWKQNVNDAKDAEDSAKTYDFAEAINGTGNVGDVINTAAATSKSYEGFKLNSGKTQTDVTITPEGTAVANVYFDREQVTLTFQHRQNNRWVTDQTMTGLYGQTLASQGYTWPTNRWWYDDYEQGWSGYSGAGTRTTFLAAFILSGGNTEQTFYGFNGNGSNTVHFMQQNANGSGYTEANTVSTGSGTFNISDKYNGFKAVSYSTNGTTWTPLGEKDSNGYYAQVSNYRNLYIRYDRANYSILYYDGVYVDRDDKPVEGYESRGKLHEADNLAYGTDLKSYNKGGANAYTPTYDGFVFDGWYVDELCTQAYEFTTMPEGVTVYAKWKQAYARVFLRPNAGTDASLNWGSEDQAMNFLIPYGGSISAPFGTRNEYEFVGWFLNTGSFFNQEAYVVSTTIDDDYDKTVDMTDPMDKWGNGATTNNDVDRAWVIGKVELNGKWRAALTGANGIGIVYDENVKGGGEDGTAPSDNTLYVDSAKAIAQLGSTPADTENQKFEYWVVQKWDGEKYVDTDTTVFAGEEFEVLKANACVVENEGSTAENPSFTYTVKLRAEYGPKTSPTPTHIVWHANNNTDAKVAESEDLKINEAVDVRPANTFSYEGYKFVGWAKLADDATPASPTDDSDLWLKYDEETNAFTEVGTGKTVTQVAADEKTPYEDLYAVWEAVDVDYTVEFYYQDENGEYTKDESLTDTRQAKTDTEAEATDADKAQTKNDKYVLNTSKSELSATVKGDGSTVLKLYFDLNKVDVTVEHYLKGETTAFDTDVVKDQIVGDTFTATPKTTYQEKNLTVDSYDPSVSITVKTADNVIKIYYTLPLTITAKTDSKTYDGKPLDGAYTVEGALGTGDQANILTALDKAPSITNVADSPKEYLTEEDQAKITGIPAYYVVTYTPGTLTINPKEVTITTGTDSKAYDGTALTKDEANIEGLVEGESVTLKANGTITEVGSVDNTYTITWDKATESNYTVTDKLGKLTITENSATVTLTAATDSKTYDGTALTNAAVTATGLPEGFTAEATASGSQTNVGESANVVDDGYVIKNAAGEDKTANFTDVKKVDGKLTVNPKAVTITTGSDSKAYDGTPLTKDEASIDGLVEGESVTLKATGTITEVGSADNTYSITWDNATESNYTVTDNLGTLTITENDAEVVLTAATDSKTYDGTALTNAAVTATGLPEGFTVEATASGSQTDAGESANVVNDGYVIKDAAGNDKTKNFTKVTKVDGKLTVNPKAVTITTGSDSKAYDGTPLTKDEAAIEGLVKGESVTLKATGTITEVGEEDNTYSIKWDNAKESNYTVTDNLGTLTITKNDVAVKLTAATDSKTYDGTALTNTAVTATGLPEGFTVEATASGSQTTVGSSKNVVDDGYVIKDAAGKDKTENFTNVTKVDGELTVNPKEVKITTGSASKSYDGEPLTKDEANIEGLVNGEKATVKATGEQTLVGTSTNTYDIDWGETDKDNYTVTEELGTLEVTDKDVPNDKVVTKKDESGNTAYKLGDTVEWTVWVKNIYDEEKTLTVTEVEGMTIVDQDKLPQTLQAGEEITIKVQHVVTVEDVKAGSITNTVTVKLGDLTKPGEDEVKTEPIKIEITANSDSKYYDGTPLTNDGYELTDGELADGNKIDSVKVTGSQTLVGKSDNVADKAKIVDAEGKDTTDAYEITYKKGSLEVLSRTNDDDDPTNDKYEVEYDVKSGTFTYDGKPHKVSGYKQDLIYTNDKDVTFTVSGIKAELEKTDAGEYPVVSDNTKFKVSDPEGNDVTDQFTLKTNDGKLTINPAELPKDPDDPSNTRFTVTGPEDKIYDGSDKPQSVTVKDTKTGKELKKGTDCTITYGDDTKNVGEVSVTVEGKGNYTGSFDRTYNITPRPITFTSADKSKVYDGKALKGKKTDIEVGGMGFAPGETVDYDMTGSQTNVGKSKNSFEILWAPEETNDAEPAEDDMYVTMAEDGSEDEEVATADVAANGPTALKSNYKFTKKEGTLEVTKAELTIKTGSDEKEYDGKPLTCDEASIEGLVNGDDVAITATGSQTEVGSSDNTYSLDWGDVDPDNYEIVEEDLGTLKVTAKEEKDEPKPPIKHDDKPKTGDPSDMTPFCLAAGAAGTALLLLAVSRKKRKEEK